MIGCVQEIQVKLEQWSGNRDYAKYAASEEDVLNLLWLTKIKVS